MKVSTAIFLFSIGTAVALPQDKPVHKEVFTLPRFSQPLNARPGANRIAGGDEAEPHSIPYQVAISITISAEEPSYTFCSGTLISPTDILTVAHCFALYGYERFDVILGAHSLLNAEDTQVIFRNLTEVLIFPNYTTTTNAELADNDIAIIHLPEPVELNDAINVPLNIPYSSDKPIEEYMNANISGWGHISENDTNADNLTLHVAEVYLLDRYECQEYILGDYYNDHLLCSNGIQLCYDDIGAPVISSAGTFVGMGNLIFLIDGKCNDELGSGNGYIRVAPYLDWILENTNLID